MTEADAKYHVENFAKRDANGSLLCMTCKDPYPYAETDDDGRFHCYDCRLTKRMKEEVAIKPVVHEEKASISITVSTTTGVVSAPINNSWSSHVVYKTT